jgi:hypothetical protein
MLFCCKISLLPSLACAAQVIMTPGPLFFYSSGGGRGTHRLGDLHKRAKRRRACSLEFPWRQTSSPPSPLFVLGHSWQARKHNHMAILSHVPYLGTKPSHANRATSGTSSLSRYGERVIDHAIYHLVQLSILLVTYPEPSNANTKDDTRQLLDAQRVVTLLCYSPGPRVS